ncbi:RAMP superfamily CRISPR-associated protein [Nocardia sp. NPDC050697]|uniref:RAMP superfamily CRISPR-associated protein n=1 Tax=Nocardia sp. NPDC050697 TaxID=3155158 RepID=UPI0033D48B02
MRSTLFTVRLRLATAGGVSAPEDLRTETLTSPDGEVRVRNTRPLRRDPTGAPHLPGTTIAGSLRAHCTTIPALRDAFGPAPGAETRTASPIQVLGSITRTTTPPQHRGRTAIDRHRAAARTHTLHWNETLVAGTEFDIFLRWDDATEEQLTALDAALGHWNPRLGAGASLGAGRAQVIALGHRSYDLRSEAGLTDWLAITGPADYPAPHPLTPEPPPAPLLQRTLRIVEALHIGTGTTRPADGGGDGEIADIVTRNGTPIVPGSTLKGVLRSRVEYICRVLGAPACEHADCGHCRPCLLFGHGAPDENGTPGRARIAIGDAEIRHARREQRRHVAIDRFTGGARNQLLYTHDVITTGEFDLVIDHLGEHEPDPTDLALLTAALDDLHDGLIGLGARTTAGYGTVELTHPGPSPARTDLSALLPPGTP